MDDALRFLIYALATFRLSLLLADDSGPWKFLSKFRSLLKREEKKSPMLKKSDLAHGVECIRCNGIWMGSLVATYHGCRGLLPEWAPMGDGFLLAMALSSGAILFHRAFPSK